MYPILPDDFENALSIPEEDMHNRGSNGQIVANLRQNLGAGKPWKALRPMSRTARAKAMRDVRRPLTFLHLVLNRCPRY